MELIFFFIWKQSKNAIAATLTYNRNRIKKILRLSLQFWFIRNNPIQAFSCGTARVSWLELLIRIREVIKALLTSSKRKKTYSIGLISRCTHLFSTSNSKTYYYNDAADLQTQLNHCLLWPWSKVYYCCSPISFVVFDVCTVTVWQ